MTNSSEQPTLASRAASAAAWLATQTVVTRVVSLATMFILMRYLLTPEQYGLNALLITITLISRHLVNPGTDEVLLQKQHRLGRWVSAAFWFNLMTGVLGAGVLIASTLIVVKLAQHWNNEAYGSPELVKMALITAIASPLSAMILVPDTILRAQLRFREISVIAIGEAIAQHGLTVLFAWQGFGAYSFVLPMPIVAALRLVAVLALARPRILATPGAYRWPALARSARWLFGQRVLKTGRDHGDQIALGLFVQSTEVNGLYAQAVNLSSQVVRLMCENLLKVLLPVLNTIRGDQERLEGATIRAARALTTMIIPLLVCQIVLAGPLVRMIGEQWQPIVPMVQLLTLGPVLYAAVYPMNAMISAMGRFSMAFYLSLLNLVTFLAIVTPLTWFFSALGAASGVAIWSWLTAIVTAVAAFRSVRGIRITFSVVSRPLLAVLIASIPAAALVLFVPVGAGFRYVKLGIGIPTIFALYYPLMKWLDPEAVEFVATRVFAKFRPLLPGARRRALVEPPELAGSSKLLD